MAERDEDKLDTAVVLVGSPISGFTVYGPFPTLEEAEDWAGNLEDCEGWAMRVFPVAEHHS